LSLRRRILIADTNKAMTELRDALGGNEIEVLHASSFDDAMKKAEASQPDLYMVGYHFDEARPYRLVTQLRSEPWAAKKPILVIRALALYVLEGESEDALRESYQALGASDYLPLHSDLERYGRDAALQRFREAVIRHLRG
jgi:PleD family two-component response regulator